MNTPKWAQDLILDAVLFLQSKGYQAELPDVKWRKAGSFNGKYGRLFRATSSGVCYRDHIRINAGHDRKDCKLIILHELAHWVLPIKDKLGGFTLDENGNPGMPFIEEHEGHTARFWDVAWMLYREFKLPVRYCLQREKEYRKGAVLAYRRSK